MGSPGRGSERSSARSTRGGPSSGKSSLAGNGREEDGLCEGLAYLQLLDCFPAFADDQAHFRRRDKELLDSAVAIDVIMKARSVPTAVHNLPQEPLGLSLGGKRTTREAALNEGSRCPRKGNSPGGKHEGVKAALHPAAAPAPTTRQASAIRYATGLE